MTPRRLLGVCAWIVVAAVGCAEADQTGISEPFRIEAPAQFVKGPLPGDAPGDGGIVMPMADAGDDAAPAIKLVESLNLVVEQGQGHKKITGTATSATYAVAAAFDEGSGYWVVPIGPPDPVTGDLTWELFTGYGSDLKPGKHTLRIVAVDENDEGTLQYSLPICVAGVAPDATHACDSAAPPRAVISLSWDTNVDLDLQVRAPDGTLLDTKKHRQLPAPPEAAEAVLDHDSNSNCVIDGVRTESLVWSTVAPSGKYGIYVNMYDACKQPAAHFEVSVYSVVAKKNGDEQLHRWYSQSGELLDLSANGGSQMGLFVTEFVFK